MQHMETVLTGKITNGKWQQKGLHNFCEHCLKYTKMNDIQCPHCGKKQP